MSNHKRGQTAIEFISTYSWSLIILVIFLAVIAAFVFTRGSTTYSPSYCYISAELVCQSMVVSANSVGASVTLIFINELGTKILFPANSFSVSTTFSQGRTFGSCNPTNTPEGGIEICNTLILGYHPALGAQLSPQFTVSYQICQKAACPPQVYNTSGTGTVFVSPSTQIIVPVSLYTSPISSGVSLKGVQYPSNTQVELITGVNYSVYATVISGFVFSHWGTSGSVTIASTSSQSTTLSANGAGGSLTAYYSAIPPVGSSSGSAGSGSSQNSGPTGSIYYVPITLTNSQSSPTPAPFQQLVSIDSNNYATYINHNWMNVEFSTGPAASGTILPAWVESNPVNTATNTLVWIRLPSAIGATSNTVIYMNFMSANVMSSSGPTGEAPQLSSGYGQYDDGSNVFGFYDNFAGSSLKAAWSTWAQSPGTQIDTVNNGLQIAASGSGSAGIYNTYTLPSLPYIAEGYLSTTGYGGVGSAGTATAGPALEDDGAADYWKMSAWSNLGTYNTGSAAGTASTSTYYVVTLDLISASSESGQANYGSSIISAAYTANPTNFMIYSYESTTSYTWVRARAYPPSGVMPSNSVGAVSSACTPSALPAGINYYACVVMQNTQASAYAANSQIILPINAGEYSSYEAGNMQNVEFFYSNGTIVPSWLEGVSGNEGQTSGLNGASDLLYWVRINSGNFLPASGSNAIFMGFAAAGTNLFNGAAVGEAPQLSPTYAQYDNGASVFGFYDNFKGPSLAGSWSSFGTAQTTTVSNGLTISGSHAFGGYLNSAQGGYSGGTAVIDAYVSGQCGSGYVYGIGQYTGALYNGGYDSANEWFINAVSSGTAGAQTGGTGGTCTSGAQYVLTGINTGSSQSLYTNYASQGITGSLSDTANSNIALYSWAGPTFFQWVRARTYTPGGAMPTVTTQGLV